MKIDIYIEIFVIRYTWKASSPEFRATWSQMGYFGSIIFLGYLAFQAGSACWALLESLPALSQHDVWTGAEAASGTLRTLFAQLSTSFIYLSFIFARPPLGGTAYGRSSRSHVRRKLLWFRPKDVALRDACARQEVLSSASQGVRQRSSTGDAPQRQVFCLLPATVIPIS